jgi:hypothetical protein
MISLKWSTSNQGQTVTVKGQDGKWMRLFKEGHFVSPYACFPYIARQPHYWQCQ